MSPDQSLLLHSGNTLIPKQLLVRSPEANYADDAYNSLSIEGYRVTPELIEKVRTGIWNPEGSENDQKERDAMAARGYFQAFQLVKQSIRAVLKGENAGEVVDNDHNDWYRELFAPSVTSGLIRASDLAGYRNNQVYIYRTTLIQCHVSFRRLLLVCNSSGTA